MKLLKPILFLFVGLFASAALADVRQGLVSYWSMEGLDAGGMVPDEGFGNHLTPNGAVEFVADPVRGNVLSLGGVPSDAYLSIFHSTNNLETGLPISASGTYTIMMWVKAPAQTATYLYSEGFGDDPPNNTPIFIIQTGQAAANNDKLDVIIRTSTTGSVINHRVTETVVFDDTWRHIAFVDNRGSVQVYIDGELDPTDFDYNYVDGALVVNQTAIGTLIRDVVHGSRFNGLIDELTIWERALTQAEVQEVMNDGIATPIPDFPPFFTSHPQSATLAEGDRVTLAAAAAGQRPISYQWKKDGENIMGATDRMLSLSQLTPEGSGSYSVVATNPGGSIESEAAELTVEPDPEPDLVSGLIYYWPLDEVGDSLTPDLASNHPMELVNPDYINLVEGRFGNALAFAGNLGDPEINPYARRTSGSPVYNNPTYSISLWVRGFGIGQADVRAFSEGSTTANQPLFNIGTHIGGESSQLRMYIRNSEDQVLVSQHSTADVFDGEWRHVVWVDDNGDAKLYIDGVLDESNFAYTRTGTMALNTTSIGGILRANPSHWFAGDIDEVAVWNRVLSLTEIQKIRAEGVEAPPDAVPPSITTQPQGATAFSGASVTFSVLASGTAPFSFQWHQDGTPIVGATEDTLVLTNVQMADAGEYTVTVTNQAGEATSQPAVLEVIQRPPTPSELRVDFNHRGNETPELTEDGFESFALLGSGNDQTALTTTRAYSGVEVSVAGSGTTTVASRLRATPVNEGAFTQERLLRDFVFGGGGENQGIDLTIAFLKPNQHYQMTVWSFDTGSTGNRISDWFANGELVREAYTFNGSNLPATDDDYQFSFNVQADASGTILIEIRRRPENTSFAAFINAFALVEALPPDSLEIAGFERVNGNVRLIIATSNPAGDHRIDQTSQIAPAEWTEVAGVAFSLEGDLLIAQFPAPAAGQQFYRAVFLPAPALFFDDFEGEEKGWTTGGPGTPPWEKGTPTIGPGVAHSGANAWGTGLHEPYGTNAEQWLRSPPINLTGVSAATLEFRDYRDIDEPFGSPPVMFHYAAVRIKDAGDPDGAEIVELARHAGSQTQWTRRTYTLPPEALDRSIIIEFLLGSDGVASQAGDAGWFIDDVTIMAE